MAELETVDDCKSWCDSWAEAAPPVKCISEAIAVLQEPNSRTRKAELQRMWNFWDVQQKPAQKKRKLSEIEAELEGKILKETRRLKEFHGLHGSFSRVAFFLCRTTFQHDRLIMSRCSCFVVSTKKY